MKSILLITARFDPAADLLLAELRRRDVPCVRWNTDHFPLDSVLTYRASNSDFGAEFVSDGRRIDLAGIGRVVSARRNRETELLEGALSSVGIEACVDDEMIELQHQGMAGVAVPVAVVE